MTLKIEGQRFGKLVAIRHIPKKEIGKLSLWLFRCDCGNEYISKFYPIKSGKVHSCGCSRFASGFGHGLCHLPEYKIWKGMKARCYNPHNNSYRWYGKRGIAVCERWLHSFANFMEDMGPRPGPEWSIDRVDCTANYTKENCKWSTSTEQSRNTSRTVYVTYNGKRKSMPEWAEHLEIDYDTLRQRFRKKDVSVEVALSAPLRRTRSKDFVINFRGQEHSLSDWARILGINKRTLHSRIYGYGFSVERAFTEPVGHNTRGSTGYTLNPIPLEK